MTQPSRSPRSSVALGIQILQNGPMKQDEFALALYEVGGDASRNEVASMGGISKGDRKVPKGAFGRWLAEHDEAFEVTKIKGRSSETGAQQASLPLEHRVPRTVVVVL